jgi:hypothetical protein
LAFATVVLGCLLGKPPLSILVRRLVEGVYTMDLGAEVLQYRRVAK